MDESIEKQNALNMSVIEYRMHNGITRPPLVGVGAKGLLSVSVFLNGQIGSSFGVSLPSIV